MVSTEYEEWETLIRDRFRLQDDIDAVEEGSKIDANQARAEEDMQRSTIKEIENGINPSDKVSIEIKYATVITLDNSLTEKNVIGKIILCDLQKIIYPKIENIFLDLIKKAGYPELKFEKKG